MAKFGEAAIIQVSSLNRSCVAFQLACYKAFVQRYSIPRLCLPKFDKFFVREDCHFGNWVMRQFHTQSHMHCWVANVHAASTFYTNDEILVYEDRKLHSLDSICYSNSIIKQHSEAMSGANDNCGMNDEGHALRITSAGKIVVPSSPTRFSGRDELSLPNTTTTHSPKFLPSNTNTTVHSHTPRTSTTMARGTAARIRAYQQYLEGVDKALDSDIQEATRKMMAKERAVREKGGVEMEAILRDKRNINTRREVRPNPERKWSRSRH